MHAATIPFLPKYYQNMGESATANFIIKSDDASICQEMMIFAYLKVEQHYLK